jgi:hypothetical protein
MQKKIQRLRHLKSRLHPTQNLQRTLLSPEAPLSSRQDQAVSPPTQIHQHQPNTDAFLLAQGLCQHPVKLAQRASLLLPLHTVVHSLQLEISTTHTLPTNELHSQEISMPLTPDLNSVAKALDIRIRPAHPLSTCQDHHEVQRISKAAWRKDHHCSVAERKTTCHICTTIVLRSVASMGL